MSDIIDNLSDDGAQTAPPSADETAEQGQDAALSQVTMAAIQRQIALALGQPELSAAEARDYIATHGLWATLALLGDYLQLEVQGQILHINLCADGRAELSAEQGAYLREKYGASGARLPGILALFAELGELDILSTAQVMAQLTILRQALSEAAAPEQQQLRRLQTWEAWRAWYSEGLARAEAEVAALLETDATTSQLAVANAGRDDQAKLWQVFDKICPTHGPATIAMNQLWL